MKNLNYNLLKNVQNAMFVIMSLALAIFINFPIIPIFPFIKFDISDIPIFISTIVFGVSSGISAFVTALLIRTFFFSSAGILGFIIRLTTIILILSFKNLHKNPKFTLKNVLYVSIGIVAFLAVKLTLNYFIWGYLICIVSKEVLNSAMFTILLPFNLAKIILNLYLAMFFSKKLKNMRIL